MKSRLELKREMTFYFTYNNFRYYVDYNSLTKGFENIFDCVLYKMDVEVGKDYFCLSFNIKKYNDLEIIFDKLRSYNMSYTIQKCKRREHLYFSIGFSPAWKSISFYNEIFRKIEKGDNEHNDELFIRVNDKYYNIKDIKDEIDSDEYILLTKKYL